MLRLAQGINTLGVVQALARQPELFGAFGRSPTKVELRGAKPDGTLVNFPSLDCLWQIRPLVFSHMTQVEGEMLGEVTIHQLGAGAVLDLVAADFQLYVVLLDAKPGVLLGPMMALGGESWWVGGSATLVNNSGFEANVLAIQIKPSVPSDFVPPALEQPNADIPS